MRTVKSILMFLILLVIASYSVTAQKAAPPKRRTPADALVSELYRQHARKHGPFFQTRSRALLRQYFTRNLADLIWNDQVSAKGEVGALDGDPLYNAQDMEIKHLVLHKAAYTNGQAEVVVSFENFGKKQEIVFLLVSERAKWKISNIKYQDGTDLLGILKPRP